MKRKIGLEEKELLNAFLDPVRLSIIDLLLEHGKLYPTQIMEMLGEDSSNVVYHLRILEKAGLVKSRYEAKDQHKFFKFYYLDEKNLNKTLSLLKKYKLLQK